MAIYTRNNLDQSSSPYLQQHKENPIFWQEWSREVLDHAKEQGKLIFVSLGYATCHWCHVMANKAFSDATIAEYLNEQFICIKVDKEQRPDLDEYFMSFAQSTIGHGGWPLNVFLTPEAKPFFVGTYFPIKQKQGIPGFLQTVKQVKKWFDEHKTSITEFVIDPPEQERVEETKLFDLLLRGFDNQYGGFGFETKFPPPSTLIFLLSWYEETNEAHLIPLITRTLNEMMNNGLHDHLQGGFFRYAVDRQWQIPHFEKMLYDQAMHLWVYSWAYHLFKREEYKVVVEKLIICLAETFKDESGLFYAALDADSNHQEGETYLWDYAELKTLLSKEELQEFWDTYIISKTGNFEGKNHLVKTEEGKTNSSNSLKEIEEKLLSYRKKREQPFVDKKIVTSWNALLGIGLIQAARYCDQKDAGLMAERIFSLLIERHLVDGNIIHSSLGGKKQEEAFLEDSASVLLLASYLNESSLDEEGIERLSSLLARTEAFKQEGEWYANLSQSDFKIIPATKYDHPIPSAVSLAELAVFRARKLLGKEQEYEAKPYAFPTQYDFANYLQFLQKGALHEIHSAAELPYEQLPLNVLQIKGDKLQDCYKFQCRLFENEKDLLQSMQVKTKNYDEKN